MAAKNTLLQRDIDDVLSVRDGKLYVEECAVDELVAQYGSPIFIASEKKLRGNIRKFQKAFSKHWKHGPAEILPAFKSNTLLAFRRILTQEGAGADIYSEAEFYGLKKAGMHPEKVSVNGGGKTEAFLEKCIQAGVRITIEDIDEPEKIERIAKKLGVKAKVRLRIKPAFPRLNIPTEFSAEKITSDFANQLYKSGIPPEYLPELGKKILAMEHVELMGFHMHTGRHSASLKYWRITAQYFARLVGKLCREWNYTPKELDLGGGYASPRDPFSKANPRGDVLLTWLTWPLLLVLGWVSPTLRYKLLSFLAGSLLTKKASQKRAPEVDDYARVVAGAVSDTLQRAGVDLKGVKLQVEPGRATYGDTVLHACRVKKVKRQTWPMKLNWVLTDTTMFFFSYSFFEFNLHDYCVANKAAEKPTQIADVVGHSCYADRLLPWVPLPEVEEGDVIAFFDAGAYTDSSAGNFNALPRPATVLVSGESATVIRRGEEITDVFQRDVIPDFLDDEIGS